MIFVIKYQVGDKVMMRKKHPCGGYEWEIIRFGADVKIQCLTCNRIVMLNRPQFLKNIKQKGIKKSA